LFLASFRQYNFLKICTPRHRTFHVHRPLKNDSFALPTADATANDIDSADALIVGAPTWHTDSEDQRSGTAWDDWLYSSLPNRNVQGGSGALVFGVGDSASYSEYYCDAAGELYDQFVKAGAKVYGFVSTEGYEHSASKAEKDGKFVGCMFDEDNQYDLSEERANKWVQQLKDEGFF